MSSPDNDPISELMSREGLSYPEAVEKLAGEKLGATGEFPKAKLEEGDEGELTAALTIRNGKVRLDFGPKPVAWLVLDPDAALAFGSTIIDCAMSIKTAGARAMREAFGETKQ